MVFPDPLAPTSAILRPGGIIRSKRSRAAGPFGRYRTVTPSSATVGGPVGIGAGSFGVADPGRLVHELEDAGSGGEHRGELLGGGG